MVIADKKQTDKVVDLRKIRSGEASISSLCPYVTGA